MLYFAYGSNMSSPRLVARVPSASVVNVARLDRHRLRFHKQSVDGSAKCDIEFTTEEQDSVHGVVFDIAPEEKADLDHYEGVGSGYAQKSVTVCMADGKQVDALTYYATQINPALKPYAWYREHVLRGAREHGLPADYLRAIADIEVIADPDRERHNSELSIYPDDC